MSDRARVAQRSLRFTESVIREMTRLANQHGAINLSQGFPDFPCSPELVELVNKAMKNGFNQYAPMSGWMPLREVLAEKTERMYGANYDAENEITITAGATQAIYTAISFSAS